MHRRLEPGESITVTARVWTARPTRFPALAARYRDDVVITDRRIMVWECGWWTRRARRRVLADRLDEIRVTDATSSSRAKTDGTVTRVRVDHEGRPPVVLDIRPDPAGRRLAAALLDAGARGPAPAPATAPPTIGAVDPA